MNTSSLTQSDRDLIIALADDYTNIFRISPAEDRADVIKLDDFITDEIGDQKEGLCYSKILRDYSLERVLPEDCGSFWKNCCKENLIEEMEYKSLLHGKYRVVKDDEIHYYNYKFVKVSSLGDPLRIVAAFRNVDDLEAKDQMRLSQLEHFRSIMASSQMGTWNLYVEEGKKSRLQPDSKMKEIMGIPNDLYLTEEQMAEMLETRIHRSDKYLFERYGINLRSGKRAECTYRWNHPSLGWCYMRCGGVAVSNEDGVCHMNGYHYDVTEQITKEIRSNQIIKSFARTYEFINYINMDDDSFITYSEKEIEDDALISVLMAGNATAAINIGLEDIVSDDFREKMREFTDLTTINERMATTNVIVGEYTDVNGVWHECSFTVADRRYDGTIKNLLWAVRFIDNEKQIELKRQKQLEDNIAANKAKTKFLHNMSHEIRTPLNALFGFAQLLGLPDGSCTEDEKELYNSYIYNSYKMLEMLISDIIDIADSEHGNYRIELSDVCVNSVCKNAIMSVEYRVPANVKTYYTSDYPDDHTITSDERRIQQVLINFLTNACKNTTQGEIHLHCSPNEHPGKVTFSVTDTGRGVPKDKANVIFNRFTKLNEFVQGSGLGLNICQTIASKLDGEVYLDTSYTEGARFVFVVSDKK